VSEITGVLVMAHGTPGSAEEIEPFYTRIRRGAPPSPAQLEDLVRRYEAIGGLSPLRERTQAQVNGLAALLEAEDRGRFIVAYGAKHSEPSVEEAAKDLAGRGVSSIIGIVLTPHRSSRGSGEYLERAAQAVGNEGSKPRFVKIEQWFDAPGFPELLARRLTAELAHSPSIPTVLFTAHSLPESVRAAGDPYPEQVERSAELVAEAAERAGSPVSWQVAWQSAGRTEQKWLSPDLLSTLDDLSHAGSSAVVVCPIGFVSDHLEILYDLDIEAKGRAEGAGLWFGRTQSLNDDPEFLSILAGVVRDAAGRAEDR
jgi:protoporphyrin/coproporphyrin ferrochelatase